MTTQTTEERKVEDELYRVRFRIGRLALTGDAIASVPVEEWIIGLSRHIRGDWGLFDEEDRQENEFSVDKHLRLLSAYETEDGVKYWIITEADRSQTTILLPDNY